MDIFFRICYIISSYLFIFQNKLLILACLDITEPSKQNDDWYTSKSNFLIFPPSVMKPIKSTFHIPHLTLFSLSILRRQEIIWLYISFYLALLKSRWNQGLGDISWLEWNWTISCGLDHYEIANGKDADLKCDIERERVFSYISIKQSCKYVYVLNSLLQGVGHRHSFLFLLPFPTPTI